MIADLKPYPAYKDSGVPWLGEVPAHWEVRKLKHAVSFSGGGTPSKADATFWNGHIPWVSPKDMQRARITDTADHITDEAVKASATSVVSPGALLMVVRSGILRRTIPVAINAVEVALNQDMKALRPKPGFMGEYLLALVQGNEAKLIAEWTKQGTTVESIEHAFLANSRIPIPPLPEQTAIVRFLNHADRRIRRYIRAKQKLIKLLEEQKQAVIHRAVIRGLDPDVRLKPSGVEWLGDVPEHWGVRRLYQITNPDRPIMYGIVLPGPNVNEGVYIVKGGNCEPGRLRPDLLSRTTFEIESRYGRSRLAADDIVFAIRGGVGAAELVPRELAGANMTQDAARISAGVSVDPRWLLYAVSAPVFREHVKSQVVGATVSGINIRSLKRIALVVPPYLEQKEIVEYIVGATSEIAAALDRARREISLLREYRTRLIGDVVTGKLDVREAAAQLPDEVAAPEPLDEADALIGAENVAADDLGAEPEVAKA